MILAKKYPVVYNGEKYYVKIVKNDYQEYINSCVVKLYKRVWLFNIKLFEVDGDYTIGMDNDYQFFANSVIEEYRKTKEHEAVNKKAFDEWDGVCN